MAKALYAVLPATLAREALKAVPQYGLLLGFVALCTVLSILSPVFLTSSNLFNVALQASVVAILAFGQTFVILSRGIDLSVGSVLALSGAVMATFTGRYGVAVGLIVGLLLGGILGTTNGVFVTRAKVAPFVATLAMLAVARGLEPARGFRNAEVEHADAAVRFDHHVVGFQVAMDDALLVRGRQSGGNLRCQIQRFLEG